MKKILFLLVCAIILSNCDISPRKANAYYKLAGFAYEGAGYNVYYDYATFNNMKYVIGEAFNGGIVIINITKDSLECEYYRKQLK